MSDSRDLAFTVLKEEWNIYKLEDNTILKVKIVLMRIIEEGLDPQGNPIAQLAINTIVASIPPDNLRKIKEIEKSFDMKYETINEYWNEYSVEDGSVLRIKPTISQIDRADKLDIRNEPSYNVSIQPSFKRLPKGIK